MSAEAPSIVAAVELRGLPRLTWGWTAVGLAFLGVALGIGVLVGPVRMSPGDVLLALLSALHVRGAPGLADPGQASILWSLRLPRVVLGAIVGGMLATAGAAYQGVFRNPLADPYLLGAAAGAELGATLAIAFLAAASPAFVNVVPMAAFVGATLAVGAAYALGRTVTGSRNPTTLILAGVAIASFLNAVQIYVQQAQTNSFRQVYTWILGRLVTAGWDGVLLIAPYVALSLAVIFATAGCSTRSASATRKRPAWVSRRVVCDWWSWPRQRWEPPPRWRSRGPSPSLGSSSRTPFGCSSAAATGW